MPTTSSAIEVGEVQQIQESKTNKNFGKKSHKIRRRVQIGGGIPVAAETSHDRRLKDCRSKRRGRKKSRRRSKENGGRYLDAVCLTVTGTKRPYRLKTDLRLLFSSLKIFTFLKKKIKYFYIYLFELEKTNYFRLKNLQQKNLLL